MTLPGVDVPPPPYRAAAIQFDPTLFSKPVNLEALLRLTKEATTGGAKRIATLLLSSERRTPVPAGSGLH